jgi:hypothetical protein
VLVADSHSPSREVDGIFKLICLTIAKARIFASIANDPYRSEIRIVFVEKLLVHAYFTRKAKPIVCRPK